MLLIWDIETRSAADLEAAGAWRYAADPTTEVLCVGYAADADAPKIWIPDQPIPAEFIKAAWDPSSILVAHNDQFERAIETRLLARKYGWPRVPIARRRCTMAAALAAALPGALETVVKALGLPEKDAEGFNLMKKMARPRRPRKGEDPCVLHWIDGAAQRERLQQYCMRDVEIERALFHRLPPLSLSEQELWELDALINERGFHVDLALAVAARDMAHSERAAVNAEVTMISGGEITSIDQVARITDFVRRHGHALSGLTKQSVSAVLAHGPDEEVERLLELRQEGARASARKLDRLLLSVDADQRLRGTLRFHGAATGRWSGRGFQPQNLKKVKTVDIGAAVDAILAHDVDRVRELGAPLTLAGEIARSIVCAAPGHVLIGADFSSIESRVLSWLAEEDWKLATYREFDRTKDPTLEPYCVGSSRVLKRAVTPADETGRELGKTFDLSFGFGGGLGAWRRFDTSDTYNDAEVEQFKAEWRRAHPATTRFWRALERAAHLAIYTRQPASVGATFSFAMEAGALIMTLPSGRRLAYPEARLVAGKFEGTREVQYRDNARGAWTVRGAWYGTLVENAVSAVSRDLLAAAMHRLEAASYPVVLHVHDEVICEVLEGFGSEDEFLRLMLQLPDWAGCLPIAAKVWSGRRYAKTTPHGPTKRLKTTVSAEPQAVSIQPYVREEIFSDEETSSMVPLACLIGEPLVEGKICCPFHEDSTPSLHVYDDHYHCFGCGAHGDAVDWLMQAEGLSRAEARHRLETWDGPTTVPPMLHDDDIKRGFALRLWEEARPIGTTLAERYLAERRRIDTAVLPGDEALRFHPHCAFGPGVRHPCLLALLRNAATDVPVGIHRIALAPDASKIGRRILGASGVIKLWQAGNQLVVGEGLETTLAAASRVPYRGASLRPAWSLVSSGALGRFPVLPEVERLIILVDHDDNGIGQAEAGRCTERWRRAGRTVVLLTPKRPGADFNDIIMLEQRP